MRNPAYDVCLSFVRMVLTVCVMGVMFYPSFSAADGFSSFGDHDELKNHAVVFAGDVESIQIQNQSLMTTESVLKMENACFSPAGYLGYWGYGKKAGLLLVDNQKRLSIAIFEDSIGSIEVKVLGVSQVSCR